jgi:hypothetical protein
MSNKMPLQRIVTGKEEGEDEGEERGDEDIS